MKRRICQWVLCLCKIAHFVFVRCHSLADRSPPLSNQWDFQVEAFQELYASNMPVVKWKGRKETVRGPCPLLPLSFSLVLTYSEMGEDTGAGWWAHTLIALQSPNRVSQEEMEMSRHAKRILGIFVFQSKEKSSDYSIYLNVTFLIDLTYWFCIF